MKFRSIHRFRLLLAAAAFAVGCSGDRFSGQTEDEMFETVQEFICELGERCPNELWDGNAPSREACVSSLDDKRHYRDPIDEATRAQLNTCLDEIEEGECTATQPASCDTVDKYLDLK